MTGLVLAGTAESRAVCDLLAQHDIDAIASLAGATRQPEALSIKTRTGGFGGQQGLEEYIKNNQIDWVVDTTHPFANQISQNAYHAARACECPYVMLQRPAWTAGEGDNWVHVQGVDQAIELIDASQTVFLGTGRNTVDAFRNLDAGKIYCRVIDPPKSNYPASNGTYLVGRPPFEASEEIALFKELGIDVVIVKNAGGDGGKAKLEAARKLGLKVILIARAEHNISPIVETVDAAFDWVKGHI
ncbi:MAG: cobalt-precorrin-6A reductase [Pseudomonadota bacterium]